MYQLQQFDISSLLRLIYEVRSRAETEISACHRHDLDLYQLNSVETAWSSRRLTSQLRACGIRNVFVRCCCRQSTPTLNDAETSHLQGNYRIAWTKMSPFSATFVNSLALHTALFRGSGHHEIGPREQIPVVYVWVHGRYREAYDGYEIIDIAVREQVNFICLFLLQI
jgi:hypothetical protein